MIRPGHDTCDTCGVTATHYPNPFPHLASCPHGTGKPPICTCGHAASQHTLDALTGAHCHGCFLEGGHSQHLYELRQL